VELTSLSFETTTLSANEQSELDGLLRGFAVMYQELSDIEVSVEVIVTDRFADAVNDAFRRYLPGARAYTTTRGPGEASARLIELDDECSSVRLYFSSSNFTRSPGDTAYTLAHELAHPIFARFARQGGLRLPANTRVTFGEKIRHEGTLVSEEYRADRIANYVLRASATSTLADGTIRPTTAWDVAGQAYFDAGVTVVQDTVPKWRNHVGAMLAGSLQHTVEALITDVFHTLTILAHAEAHLEGRGSQDGGNTILDAAPLAPSEAVRLYFDPVWRDHLRAMRAAPILPSMEHMELERHLYEQSWSLIPSFLSLLGITWTGEEFRIAPQP
jgi:hypothetical protein